MFGEELLKFNLDVAASAIGFLFALLVNSFNNRRLDKKTYYAMLRAIKNEASSNNVILKDSFFEYIHPRGIVLRGFNSITSEKYLSETLFVRHAEPHVLDALNSYLRNIKLANAYREKQESLIFGPKKTSEKWLIPLINVWEKNLEQCAKDINEVMNLPDYPEASRKRIWRSEI